MLWTCVGCGCRYAPAPRCPQCGVVEIEERNVPGRVSVKPRRSKRATVVEEVSDGVGDDAEDIGLGDDPGEDSGVSP